MDGEQNGEEQRNSETYQRQKPEELRKGSEDTDRGSDQGGGESVVSPNGEEHAGERPSVLTAGPEAEPQTTTRPEAETLTAPSEADEKAAKRKELEPKVSTLKETLDSAQSALTALQRNPDSTQAKADLQETIELNDPTKMVHRSTLRNKSSSQKGKLDSMTHLLPLKQIDVNL